MPSLVTIGADPEVFLRNGATIVSAIGHVGGSKDAPVPVQCGAVQEDNVLAEFNIDPAASEDQFVTNIKTVMGQLRERVQPFDIEVISSHRFTKHELMRSGRKALLFGCDPDFNAYTGAKNVPPSARTGLRTAGGHVHVGYSGHSEQRNREIAINMDLLLGVPSVLLDSDTDRRSMYGKAGCLRHKPYGMEYRSLSNFWLAHTDVIRWVYRQAVLAASYTCTANEELLQRCINESDTTLAEKLVSEFNINMP